MILKPRGLGGCYLMQEARLPWTIQAVSKSTYRIYL